jgi:hypothetical protein
MSNKQINPGKSLEPSAEIVVPIEGRLQEPNEPYCGSITYCSISGTNQFSVERVYERMRIKPSLGCFYTSFLKIDPKAKVYIERKGNMLNSSDTKCFDTMWEFENQFQKGMTKQEFIEEIVRNNKEIYEENRRRVHFESDFVSQIKRWILRGSPVGIMVMENLNRYIRGAVGEFYIPHWVIVHGIRERRSGYLLYNSYTNDSSWVSRDELSRKIESVREYGFSRQIVVVPRNKLRRNFNGFSEK